MSLYFYPQDGGAALGPFATFTHMYRILSLRFRGCHYELNGSVIEDVDLDPAADAPNLVSSQGEVLGVCHHKNLNSP